MLLLFSAPSPVIDTKTGVEMWQIVANMLSLISGIDNLESLIHHLKVLCLILVGRLVLSLCCLPLVHTQYVVKVFIASSCQHKLHKSVNRQRAQ